MTKRFGLVCFCLMSILTTPALLIAEEPIPSATTNPTPRPVRTLADFEAQLDPTMTAALAEKKFGKPDEITGSGFIIYVYKLSDQSEIILSFAGFGPLIGARLRTLDGQVRELVFTGLQMPHDQWRELPRTNR
jgi:hypothetical protein